ncbi:MAG: Holliday junction branch migration protein RuvA [Candidatus Gracilibacteria bacterium]
MIGYLKGIVLVELERSILLDVSGVGYEVFVPERVRMTLTAGEAAEFYIYTHVREDTLQLFGFPTFPERRVFIMLLSVNGVGPKSALEIMNLSLGDLAQAISSGDALRVQKVPGIGKKTAERIIIDLEDKMLEFAGMSSEGTSNTSKKGSTSGLELEHQDVVDGLMVLGYDRKYILEILQKLDSEHDLSVLSAEEIIKLCLRYL